LDYAYAVTMHELFTRTTSCNAWISFKFQDRILFN